MSNHLDQLLEIHKYSLILLVYFLSTALIFALCRMSSKRFQLLKSKSVNNLTDSFNREHSYLRISLIEKCNLRCTYCMPAEGVTLSPPDSIMSATEVLEIAKTFVASGVTKIRLTGGEPLLRKDFETIYNGLTKLPAEIGITTNAVLLDKYLPLFKEKEMKSINISLDTLSKKKFHEITRRDQFDRVMNNIYATLKRWHPAED